MIQVGKIRKGFSFLPSITLNSIDEVLTKYQDIVEKITESERYNIYYTVAHHELGKRSKKDGSFIKQDVIPFDIDGTSGGLDKYIEVVSTALNIDPYKTGIVASGNGLHFLVKVKTITNPNYFVKYKEAYKKLCLKVQKALIDSNLDGDVDQVVFDYARVLRLPGTVNKKPKGVTKCTVVRYHLDTQDLDLKIDTKPDVIKKSSYGAVDIKGVNDGCDFLKHCRNNSENLSEPIWYAAISITSFFGDNDSTSHLLSSKHPQYDKDQTNQKANQAREAAGPRTCSYINALWGKCSECPNFQKVISPIQIKGPDFIATEFCGFTTPLYTQDGKLKGHTYHYNDLRKFYNKKHPYKILTDTGGMYQFNGTHYKSIYKQDVKTFAQENFKPELDKEQVRMEYLNTVRAYNNTMLSEFHAQEKAGMLNFKNGVLKDGVLEPSSPKYLFRYCLPFDYVLTGTTEVWDALMNRITKGRNELQDVIEEYIGFTLSGASYNEFQYMLIFSGSGNNGKTTVINIIQNMVGLDATVATNMSNLMNNKEYYLADLDGKLLCLAEEEDKKCFSSTGILKKLTGGSILQARRITEAPFNFENIAKIILSYNEMPFLSDLSPGMTRRLGIIPFDQDYELNPHLLIKDIYKKIEPEYPDIIKKCLDKFSLVRERGAFTKPKEVADEVKKIMHNSDDTLNFFSDNVRFTSNASDKIPLADLYETYQRLEEVGKNSAACLSRNGFTRKVKGLLKNSNTRIMLGIDNGSSEAISIKKVRESGTPQWCLCGAVLENEGLW